MSKVLFDFQLQIVLKVILSSVNGVRSLLRRQSLSSTVVCGIFQSTADDVFLTDPFAAVWSLVSHHFRQSASQRRSRVHITSVQSRREQESPLKKLWPFVLFVLPAKRQYDKVLHEKCSLIYFFFYVRPYVLPISILGPTWNHVLVLAFFVSYPALVRLSSLQRRTAAS